MGAPEYRRATPIAHSRGIPAGSSPGAPAAVSCCEQLGAKRRGGHGRARPPGGGGGGGEGGRRRPGGARRPTTAFAQKTGGRRLCERWGPGGGERLGAGEAELQAA